MCTCALFLLLAMSVDDPTDNPVAAFYSGPEGYPAWTDALRWPRVMNMKTYAKGKTAFEKFENARDELREGGGVLYYPAGVYDFTTMPPGRGLMLCHDVVIRGEAPKDRAVAADGKLVLPTKFVFPFRARGGGMVAADWNFIGLQVEKGKTLSSSTDNVGIACVHLLGAGVFFGPDMEWAPSWGAAGSPFSPFVKKAWRVRRPDGTHPFDAIVGGKKYRGSGKGRLVFGCVIEDAPPLDDFLDRGYGDGFSTQQHLGRIAVYGSRVLVANNLLPRSKKSFVHLQQTSRGPKPVLYDYGNTCGIDVNKEVLAATQAQGASAGYFEEGVVVRDNYVFNHGHTGFNVAGSWVTIQGNNNDRAFLRQGDKTYVPAPWLLTVDGFEVAGAASDNRSRAFDLAGRNLWIDGNRFTNTGSRPGKDGEGIACRSETGMPIYSWAITHNLHKKGIGATGYLGGAEVDCHGLFIGWNETPGWVGIMSKKAKKMSDYAVVGNKCPRVVPELKKGELKPPAPPENVSISIHDGDAVKISWRSGGAADGFRVERKIAGARWQVIAYRPPRVEGDADNPQEWVDFTAPSGKELVYRVVAINALDNDQGASGPTEAIIVVK